MNNELGDVRGAGLAAGETKAGPTGTTLKRYY